MGIGVGLFLVAAGAVLTWGITATANGVNIETIGVILMIVGGVGVFLDLIFFAPRRHHRRVVSNGPMSPDAGAARGSYYEEHDTYA